MNENRIRLLKGAKKLAEFWRAGQRCETSGWSLRDCTCDIKTTFCGAKELWLSLMVQDPAMQERGEPNPASDFGVVEMMRATELEASELTVKSDAEKLKGVRIGPKGEVLVAELLKTMDDPDAIPPTLEIKQIFPGALVETVEDPPDETLPDPEEELV